MANPNYGVDYDPSIPTPSATAVTYWGSGYANDSTIGTSLVIPTGGASLRFGLVSSVATGYAVRFAYQVRYRLSANDPNWDGGETWTDWADGNGTLDAWTELYTGNNGTNVTAVSEVIAGLAYVTSDFHPSLAYSVSTYDAIEYRIQAWYGRIKSGVFKYYGSPDVKTVRIEYVPTYTVSAAHVTSDDSLRVEMSISGWGRGAAMYTIGSIYLDGLTVSGTRSAAGGSFTYPYSEVGSVIGTASSVTVHGWVLANGNTQSFAYDVTQSITVEGIDGAVTKPVVSTTTSGGIIGFSVTDATYESVTVTVTWSGGSHDFPMSLSGGTWTADVLPPFNTACDWKVAAYKTINAVLAFNTTESSDPVTISGYGYELRAADGSSVTLTLESKEQLSTDEDATTTTLASGRTVSRYGRGTRRSISLRGQLLGSSHSATSDWIGDLAVLDLGQDLTYRNPYGEVKTVAVTSWTRAAADIWDVLDISINMTEVS